MAEPTDVDGATTAGEDAITAAWLDPDGPYLGLQLEPRDEELETVASRRAADPRS